MKITRQVVYFSTVLLLMVLSACASKVPDSSQEVTPILYRLPEITFERSVGRLRRLAIAPIRCWRGAGLIGYEDSVEKTKKALLSWTISFLKDRKGYEAIPIDLHKNLLQEKLEFSTKRIGQHLDMLADWAIESDPWNWFSQTGVTLALSRIVHLTRKAEQRPTEIVSTVSAIGRPLNVDGLVFILRIQTGGPIGSV